AVGDANAVDAAVVDSDLHLGGAGVDGVLDELFDDAGRPLDDLAGGDLVREVARQAPDLPHASSSYPSPSWGGTDSKKARARGRVSARTMRPLASERTPIA